MKKFLILIPVIFTILYLIFFSFAIEEIVQSQTQVLFEACKEDVQYMDALKITQEERIMLVSSVDAKPKIFAALYDSSLNVLSHRTISLSIGLNPFKEGYDLNQAKSGTYTVMHPHDGTVSKYLMYYNHLNTGELAIIGVANGSVQMRLSMWLYVGLFIQFVVTLWLQIWLIVVLMRNHSKLLK